MTITPDNIMTDDFYWEESNKLCKDCGHIKCLCICEGRDECCVLI